MVAVLGRVATVRIACALLCWCGILLGRPPAAAAQWLASASITEGEAFVYVSALFSAGHQCDSEWFAGQFLPSATIYLIYADGREESFGPSQYLEVFKQFCRPYNIINIKWDRHNLQVSSTGAVTSVRWSDTWGQRLRMTTGEGESKMLFENWMDLVKEGQRIRIANAGWQEYELVPGAAQEFHAIEQGYLPFYRLTRFLGEILEWPFEVYGNMKERLGRRRMEKDVARHDDSGRSNP